MQSSNNIIIVLSLTVLFLMSVISIPISAASPMANSAIHVNEGNITFTGNTQADFAGHIVYRNYMASPWGKNNNISSFYVSFNATYLFLGVSENISDNALYIFMSNNTGSDYGTYEISNLNVWARDIKFTEPLNYFRKFLF